MYTWNNIFTPALTVDIDKLAPTYRTVYHMKWHGKQWVQYTQLNHHNKCWLFTFLQTADRLKTSVFVFTMLMVFLGLGKKSTWWWSEKDHDLAYLVLPVWNTASNSNLSSRPAPPMSRDESQVIHIKPERDIAHIKMLLWYRMQSWMQHMATLNANLLF